jgi:hypothetical protein
VIVNQNNQKLQSNVYKFYGNVGGLYTDNGVISFYPSYSSFVIRDNSSKDLKLTFKAKNHLTDVLLSNIKFVIKISS